MGEIGMARGEVLVGGGSVSVGYFVDEENPDPEIVKKNSEEFVEIEHKNGKKVRYFRTGDIGQITESGTLQIIDRKKDLWKGPQGEYVSLSKVEAALKLATCVEIPMVYGRTGGEFPIALLCIIPKEIARIAEEQKVTGELAELCANEKVIAAVAAECKAKCKSKEGGSLVEFEIPKKYA